MIQLIFGFKLNLLKTDLILKTKGDFFNYLNTSVPKGLQNK